MPPTSVPEPQPPSPARDVRPRVPTSVPERLTADDYLAIQQLVAKASYDADRQRGRSYVHDFVADHVIQPSGAGGTGP